MTLKTILFAALAALPALACAHPLASSELGLDVFLKNKGFNSISYSKLSSQHAIIKVALNGASGYFILDSGAGRSVIHSESVYKFRLEPSAVGNKRTEATGIGGTIPAKPYRLNSFNIQGNAIRLKEIISMDLSHVVNALRPLSDHAIDGVIGQDVMSLHHAIIDVEAEVVYLKR